MLINIYLCIIKIWMCKRCIIYTCTDIYWKILNEIYHKQKKMFLYKCANIFFECRYTG